MGTLWIPGAERIKPSAAGGEITSTLPPRNVWHTTEAPPGTDNMWNTMIRVLTNKAAEPHILYDPVTDRLGQFLPLNVSGRALRNDGATRTNRTGRVCIQIEVIAYAKDPFTGYWKPGKNYRALMAAVRSWGIPDMFPMGPPPKYPGPSKRDRTIWLSKAGHYCHANVPGNDHGDPGAISPAKLFAAAPRAATPPAPGVTPTPPTGGTMSLTQDDKNWIEGRLQAYSNFLVLNRQQTTERDLDAIQAQLAEIDATVDRIEDDTDDGTVAP